MIFYHGMSLLIRDWDNRPPASLNDDLDLCDVIAVVVVNGSVEYGWLCCVIEEVLKINDAGAMWFCINFEK